MHSFANLPMHVCVHEYSIRVHKIYNTKVLYTDWTEEWTEEWYYFREAEEEALSSSRYFHSSYPIDNFDNRYTLEYCFKCIITSPFNLVRVLNFYLIKEKFKL